jgi:VIT1/CCC1 family predicted Fe2+/Mn2+ transporter
MSPGLLKMWTSLSGLGFMFLSIVLIYLSRFKMKNRFFKGISAVIAYTFMVISGIIIFIVVIGGPSE